VGIEEDKDAANWDVRPMRVYATDLEFLKLLRLRMSAEKDHLLSLHDVLHEVLKPLREGA
jgi:hypothetical protein